MADEIHIPDKIRFTYKTADDYKAIYANGAFGGVTSNAELRFNFFQEHYPFPESAVHHIKDGKLGEEIKDSPDKTEVEAIRESKVGILLSLEKAKIIGKWMLETVEKYEKTIEDLKSQKEEEGDSDGATSASGDTT